MAAEGNVDDRPADLEILIPDHEIGPPGTPAVRDRYQGPHDWRKRLKPVQSPIKSDSPDCLQTGEGKDEKQSKTRPLPPWKRDLIEKNKKVARLVRRESSGRSKKTAIIRRESSGRSKKPPGSESPSGVGRKKSFRNENPFTQQVVNEAMGTRRRISPANSFKRDGGVRRTPSDKAFDPNDPQTKKRLERVRRARLYLLQQMGPNSFQIVGDSPDHKFKVIIGPQTCTCGKGPQCVHLLFVMLRVFQIKETDACLWSKQLKNYEVESLFRAYNDKRSLKIEAKNHRRGQRPSPDTSHTPSPDASVVPSECDTGSMREEDDTCPICLLEMFEEESLQKCGECHNKLSMREEDDTCPICLLEMLEGESLQKCGECHNKLHHHCISVWFDECKRQNDNYICPLCRARWKNISNEIKQEEDTPAIVVETPQGPPNTRAPSPHELETTRLPYAEPIPGEYISMTSPWIEILGEDLVSCLFSRNWSIRETGLKHLAKEMSQDLVKVTGESRAGAGGMTSANSAAMIKLLECCFSVVSFMCSDPVYKVFVGCLKVLRAVFAVTPSRDNQQKVKLQSMFKPVLDAIIVKCTDGNRAVFAVTPSRDNQQKVKLQSMFKPVLDAIIVKCTDGNRRTSDLSVSTIVELAKGQHGELSVGRELNNPGTQGLGGMAYVVRCLTEKYETADITWQWLLGRLYVIEKLVVEFPTEFLPRQRPDGASSESSLEMMGAASQEEERPQNYDRLLIVAEFSIKAVSNGHARISRVAKRVFLLSAKYAVHLENMINEFRGLLINLEFSHKKSLQRQLDKIVSDFELADQLGKQLCDQMSPPDTPDLTPISTPRCTSPVTTVSDGQSDPGSTTKIQPVVPPNTPIHERRRQIHSSKINKSFDTFEELEEIPTGMKSARSLDALDSECKPRSRKSKSPVMKIPKNRSRSNTPQRIGPVLETNIDDVIKMQEETRKRNSLTTSTITDSVFAENDDCDDETDLLLTLNTSISNNPDISVPSPRLLSNDLETDIDSVEPDLDSLLKVKDGTLGNETESNPQSLITTPKIDKCVKTAPKSLKLELDQVALMEKSKRSISPCAHVKELERLSALGNISQAPCLNSLSQTNTAFSSETPVNTPKRNYSTASTVACGNFDHTDKAVQHTSPKVLNDRTNMTDDLTDYRSPINKNEKPVTFKSEVASGTPKHSPSHTLDRDTDDYQCKEEVEREEAIALARAMEISAKDFPRPVVPGLTPMDQEEVITIRIQPDDCDALDLNGNPPTLYYENVHWKKGRLLGTGAFSTCYQCRDVKTGTIMAIKQISFCRNSQSEQDKVVETITEEIHMMAKLNHPHIVRILGATRQGCHFNMFVEWMPGGSVSYLLGQYGSFSEDVTTNYILQVLRGLAYLHENHILHRDLKGANLLIDSTGYRLRIGDFGAAARLASKSTGAGEFQGQLLGTIAFMAPEVLRGENYGRACDVWSVGCCMIEMSTTKPPWNAHDVSNHLALIFKIANSQSAPPIPERLSQPLRDLLLRCLEPLKEQRPTAKELLIHPLFTQYIKK